MDVSCRPKDITMYKFFVEKEQITGSTVHIAGEDVNHIRNVLRMKPGERFLAACQDEWEYTCCIETIEADEVTARIEDAQKPGKELPSRIYLFQCLPKSDKMELVIQKAVELGAYRIVPVRSDRCVVKLDEKKAAAKVRRWNAIAESAAKQAKRMIIPRVDEVISFAQVFEYAAREKIDVRLIPYEMAKDMEQTRKIFSEIRPGQQIAVLIGPEGGFSPGEAAGAADAGFLPITLGKRILRTETAGMTVLSILMYLLEP